MGDWKNGMWANVIAATTSVVMIGLTVMMVWNSLHGS
jgi:Mn2+/Fe2+ NRAMP family transporter